jgi:DHA1 family tetracycline resistance protein-like MFS transporter
VSPSKASASGNPSRYALLFIFITLLIDVLGFGLVIPIVPKLVQELAHTSLSSTSPIYGGLQSCYGLMQFFFAPILGSLSDKLGRRPVLLSSLFCNGIDYVVMAVAPSVGWLFLGRMVSGVAGASFTTANAYIADISPPEKRAQNFGIMGAAFGIGFILGPALGGFLGSIDSRLPFWASAGLSLANFLYGYFLVPESLSLEHRRRFDWRRANPIGSIGLLGRYRATLLLASVFALSGLAMLTMQSTWVLFTTYRLGWTPRENGISLGLVGLVWGSMQAVLARKIIPKIGEPAAYVIGLSIGCVSFFAFGSVYAAWMMYSTIIFWGLAAIANPAAQSMVSKAYGPNEQGAVQGALTSIQSVTGIVGPMVGTLLFRYFTSPAAQVKIPGAPFYFAASLYLISVAVALIAVRDPVLRNEKAAAF